MLLRWKSYELPFKHPFTISKGTKTHQPTLITGLSHFGLEGYGEAPAITYYNITTAQMEAELAAKKHFIEKYAFNDPGRFWHFLHHLFPKNPFLVCALDLAGWDLYGKLRNSPINALISDTPEVGPPTDYTIGIDSIEKMVAKMQEQPWPIYKIKLGTHQDIEIMKALRGHTDATFRIDANAAWTATDALEKIEAFHQLGGIEFIEQPLAKDDWEGMAWLKSRSPLPLIADESCVMETDVARCEGHFDGINIKLTKCSGFTPALRMIKDARKRGLRVMVGSMNECSIGSAAITHLLPLIDHVDMDGPLLLAQDLATGITFTQGKATTPTDASGFGFTPVEGLFV